MKKPVYKLLDEKGRVLIPLEMRQKAEMEKDNIIFEFIFRRVKY